MNSFDCIVIGTGAAGYNAACRIKSLSDKSVAIITEGVNMGTSRNTGSDKQTYYKLGLSGDSPDSVHKMAQNLFAGGSVDGDNALCEAALSARCFMNLAELGVPFPVNRYGEYVGYKTDHDPFERATSAGPLTSKFMTEALEKNAERLDVPVYSDLLAVEILKGENGTEGVMCIDLKTEKPVFFKAPSVIICTGGPAGIYKNSVFPESQSGSTGLAIKAGARLQNMTEWQYGLASTAPRWNVSGTYMQVLPRFVSVDKDGKEYEFLKDFFKDDIYGALSNVFLKGYQWPFDSKKVLCGSSVIDLLVYIQTSLGRRVYLDFTKNPFGIENIEYEKLIPEAAEYLTKAEATFGTPIARLEKMNSPAIDLYMSKGVDITKEYLEIALCAQHNNGGIAVDKWWQTDVTGLYAAGECAGTHGIARPGGSALNAGQVGSLRAALHVCASKRSGCTDEEFEKITKNALSSHIEFMLSLSDKEQNAESLADYCREKMSSVGAAIRNKESMQKFYDELCDIEGKIGTNNAEQAYRFFDMLLTQQAVLLSMIDFADFVKSTRGSALYTDKDGSLREGLPELFRLRTDNTFADKVQSIRKTESGFEIEWRDVRPLPESGDFFENVWKGYRENGNVY
ncbi:MAG: FAD-binding protein [Clostridia bacterium]|nr:FAD-binding protein [Clostridia bacterium]